MRVFISVDMEGVAGVATFDQVIRGGTGLRVNGAAMTEAEVNALYAASLGVPVGVVTGDDEICNVARKAFPGVSAVEVKAAHGFSAADSLQPAAACELIERSVAEAVS